MGMGPLRTGEPDDEFGVASLSEINVTPLVDVMLVLLITFMVAAPLTTVGIPVNLPKTAAAKVPQPKKPEAKPVEKPVDRKPPPRRAVAEPQQPPSEARQGQASSSRENTQGAAASAGPNVLKSCGARLRASLQNRFRIPDALRSQGVNGSATVSFTVDDSGRIISSSIVGSSGHAAADQAALAAARLGSSVPPAPASVTQRRFVITLTTRVR
jgi:periplasmic protein TonB